MKNSDMPAMPIVTPDMSVEGSSGLTKLEHFAGLAMQGMLAQPNISKDVQFSVLAQHAIGAAQDLLDELEKQK